MAEYICREAIIDYLEKEIEAGNVALDEDVWINKGLRIAIRDIKDIKTADVQPVKQGHWIEKAEEYYRLWQDSGRSWDDMPYFVTGLKFACSHCFKQYDVNAEGVEEWEFCPKYGADMREKE
jgi:hypothetical protein